MSGFAVLLALAAVASPAADLAGVWVTEDRSAIVRIGACGNRICGRVIQVLRADAPATDVNNPIRGLRNRRLVGLVVLSGFSPSGVGGRAYDPKTGRSYRASLRLNPDGTLRVTGCVTIVCRSQTWTRR